MEEGDILEIIYHKLHLNDNNKKIPLKGLSLIIQKENNCETLIVL